MTSKIDEIKDTIETLSSQLRHLLDLVEQTDLDVEENIDAMGIELDEIFARVDEVDE